MWISRDGLIVFNKNIKKYIFVKYLIFYVDNCFSICIMNGNYLKKKIFEKFFFKILLNIN